MKRKRILTLFLYLTLILSTVLSVHTAASAADTQGNFSLNFSLLADDGAQVVVAHPDDVITVSFVMRRTDSDENYTTNGFQNYIHYDCSFFELVDGSIVCNDTGSAIAKKQNSVTYGEIIQCQNMGKSYESTFVFCTFQLRVIATSGSGIVYNDEVYAFDTNYQSVAVSTQHLQVLIDSGCTHANKTKVEAKPSTCQENGWSTYYDCDGCDALFDESGENMISAIPYLDLAHATGDIIYDKTGHWYECAACGERFEYAVHGGGTASCTSKATCDVCGQEYGDIDEHNHTGATVVKNQKDATYFSRGYTGDVHCADCDGLIEAGEAIAMLTFASLAWWIWLVIILAAVLILAIFIILVKDKFF